MLLVRSFDDVARWIDDVIAELAAQFHHVENALCVRVMAT
jgi:hypothetical protein